MNVLINQLSSLTPQGYNDSRCGYCGNSTGSFSYYAEAVDLRVEFYQKLLDRGWRRSGMLLYKPDLRASCCPQYTIRVNSHTYRPSKDQRQTLNKFNKSIVGEAYTRAAARLFPRTREQSRRRKQVFDLVERVNESERHEQKYPLEHAREFVVTLEPSNFTEEKFSLYLNYQENVHRDPPNTNTRNQFARFLCNTPLKNDEIGTSDNRRLLGSYHQCYYIDGKLIAMGVLDLLPQCVSAVYFIYHESMRDFNFGKLSAMREIALAKEKGYTWWYPGFYIHNCVKMRYKANYSPQYILSPESFHWHIFTQDIKRQLSLRKYLSLAAVNGSGRIYLNGNSTSSHHHEDANNRYSNIHDEREIPVYARDMPGVLSKEELLSQIDLDNIDINVGDLLIKARELDNWERSPIDSGYSIKGIVAEIAAAVGPELSREMILDFQ